MNSHYKNKTATAPEGDTSLFFSLSTDLMCVVDTQGCFLQVNAAWQQLLGITAEEIRGTSFTDYVMADDLQATQQAFQRLIKSHTLNGFVNRYRSHDGTVHHVQWQAKVHGGLIYASAKDITHEVRDQATLAEQKELLDSILENMQEGFAMRDLSGRIVRVNDAFCSMVGFTRDELIGEYPPYRHWPPEEAENMVRKSELLEEVPADNPGFRVVLMKKDGTRFPVRVTPGAITDGSGELRYVFANFQDISREEDEKKGKERVIDLLERSNEAARIGTWEVDLEKGVIYWSKVTRQIHEVPDDFVPDLQSGIHFYKEGACRDRISVAVRNAIQTGEPYDVTARIVTVNGREIWVRAIGIPEMENGSCVRFYGLFQDIHQTRELVDKLKAALEKERELSALKSRFISTVSHEFRTPLATIQSSNDILKNICQTVFPTTELSVAVQQRHQHHIRRVEEQVERLRSLLSQVLVLQETSFGPRQSLRERKDLREWIVQLQDELYNDQRYEHMALKLVLPDEPFLFETDYRLLRHVLMNLLENAYKFSEINKNPDVKAPELHLQTKNLRGTACTETDPGQVLIRVLDYGIGIPDDAKDYVFDQFYRASNAQLIKGVGLGLAIVRDLVGQLGGQVTLCNETGKGTCFTVTLPADVQQNS